MIDNPRWEIIHGDSLTVLESFPPGAFDAVITDPPYASGGRTQAEKSKATAKKYSSMGGNAPPDFDGDAKDQRSWTRWAAEWLYLARRAAKPGAPVCMFIDWRQLPCASDALQWAGWIWRGIAVWDKGNSRPQKGRFRQFVQCDIDILGDSSPNAEVELIDVTARALLKIGFTGFTVNINDRRILRGMLESMGFAADTLDSVCITFDKMDKIGAEGVKAELTEKQLPESAIHALADFIAAGDVTLDAVAARCADPAIADDLKYVLATANTLAAGRYQVAYCPSLVRGQGYYTGMVFEVTCPQFSGAVAGGGRYDNMVGKFIGQQVPAVGFSIGFERVCGILLEQGYQIPGAKPKIALLYLKDADFAAVLAKAEQLRADYDVTVLPQAKKLGKQFGTLEAAGFNAVAFADNDDIKTLGGNA